MRLNFRIKQGLGDNCQFSIVLKHIKHYHPDSYISIQAPLGTEDIYRGIVDQWSPIRYPWLNKGFDKSIYIHFAHPTHEWDLLPSSKASECLEIEMKEHGIDLEPIPELFTYNCQSTDEQKALAKEWAATLPDNRGIVFIHAEGNSMGEEKNIHGGYWTPFYHEVKEMGYLPILLNWRNLEHGLDKFSIEGEFRGDKVIYSESGMIKEILNQGCLLVGIDSGIEHIAAVSDCPTAILWKCHHPLFCFDLADNESLKHYVPDECRGLPEHKWAREFFEINYNHEYIPYPNKMFNDLKWFLSDEYETIQMTE